MAAIRLTKLDRPYPRARSNIERPLWLVQGCEVQVFCEGHPKEVMLQVKTVGLALSQDQRWLLGGVLTSWPASICHWPWSETRLDRFRELGTRLAVYSEVLGLVTYLVVWEDVLSVFVCCQELARTTPAIRAGVHGSCQLLVMSCSHSP